MNWCSRPYFVGMQHVRFARKHLGVIGLHAIFWVVYIYLVYTLWITNNIPEAEIKEGSRLPALGLRFVTEFFLFYTVYLWGIPRLLARGQIVWFILLVLFLFFSATFWRLQFEIWYVGQFPDVRFATNPDMPLGAQFIARGSSCGFVLIMAGVGRFTFDWFRSQKERKELEHQRLTSELAYLKSQVNPHFLFNTLNNIYGLARKQSPATEDAILKLSGMMRYMLYETNEAEVPLDREVKQLEDYLSLQSLRYARSEVARFETSGALEQYSIAPLLLVPLLENGFKHGRFSQPDDLLECNLAVSESGLEFQVINPVAPAMEQKDEVGGVGLENIRRRLALLYPERHTLEIRKENGHFEAMLTLQWK